MDLIKEPFMKAYASIKILIFKTPQDFLLQCITLAVPLKMVICLQTLLKHMHCPDIPQLTHSFACAGWVWMQAHMPSRSKCQKGTFWKLMILNNFSLWKSPQGTKYWSVCHTVHPKNILDEKSKIHWTQLRAQYYLLPVQWMKSCKWITWFLVGWGDQVVQER